MDTESSSGTSGLDPGPFAQGDFPDDAIRSSQSTSQPDDDLLSPPAKRLKKGPKRRVEELWKHSRAFLPHEEKQNRHGQEMFYCKYCNWRSRTNISNVRNHLKNQHGIMPTKDDTLRQQATTQALANAFSRQEQRAQSQADDKTRTILRNACNKANFRDAVARLVTSQSLAHNIVESKEFKSMCLTLNSQAAHVLIHSHTTIPRRIASNFQYQRTLVKDTLHRALSVIQLCTDSWTSGLMNQREFQAINAQWVDEQGQIQRALLALPELTQGHAGEDVAPHIVATLKMYDIERKLGFITADNATANDTLCRAVERSMCSQGIQWSAATQRLRCLGHIINIATQAFMFAKDPEAVDIAAQRTANTLSVEESIASLSQTQDQGWRRAPALQKLYDFAVDLRTLRYHGEFKRLAGKVIKIPGQTRWNGWYLMIQEAFETRPVIAQLIDRYPGLEHHRFTADD